MTGRWILPLAVLLRILGGTPALSAQTLALDEAGIRLQSSGDDVSAQLPISNRSSAAIRATVELRFLSPSDATVKAVTEDIVLRPGSSVIKIPVPKFLRSIPESDRASLLWFRLQYRISAGGTDGESKGIVSLSRTVAETFRLKVSYSEAPTPGAPWSAHVLAVGGDTGTPAPDVDIVATLALAGRTVTATGRTSASGLAALVFRIPERDPGGFQFRPPQAELTVKARRGIEVREIREDLSIYRVLTALLTTDKPIYQPGQTMRVRTLVFARGGAARAQERLQLKIEGDNGPYLSASAVTSRFGEAHMEWDIPADAGLGRYTVSVVSENGDVLATESPLVSRYHLPVFKVRAKPDRNYYLVSETPVVEIQTDYLFGQPVDRALVKILRADSATIVAEGVADSAGRFSAKLDVEVERRKLEKNRYWRYDDGRFIAYVTDPVSNRTEEARFDVRMTLEPLHVYVTWPRRPERGKPLEFLVSTQYADGSPAECSVEIRFPGDDAPSARGVGAAPKPIPMTLKTNRFGVALVDSFPFDADAEFVLLADDGKGRAGKTTFTWKRETPAIEVFTDKQIYQAGEPLRIDIESTHRTGSVFVDVSSGESNRYLESHVLQLSDGKASLTLPYSRTFAGVVVVSARYLNNAERFRLPDQRSRGVLYPRENRTLQVEAVAGKKTYGPGEDASIAFRVRSRDGAPTEGLLGVVIVDQAVDERATGLLPRVNYYRSFQTELSRAWDSLAGTALKEIQPDVRLAAEYMLDSAFGWAPNRAIHEAAIPEVDETFGKLALGQLAPFKSALGKQFEEDRSYPENETQLRAMLLPRGIDVVALRDPWGTPYRFAFSFRDSRSLVTAFSAGPDKTPQTADDFRADTISQPYFQRRGEILDQALAAYRARAGVIPVDVAELRKALLEAGHDIDAWRDPWGNPFRFEFGMSGPGLWTTKERSIYRSFLLTVRTAGVNGVFADSAATGADDAQVWYWRFSAAVTPEENRPFLKALTKYNRDKGTLPATVAEWQEALRLSGIGEGGPKDPWGRTAYPVFEKSDHPYDYLSMNLMRAARIPLDLSYNDYLEFFHSSVQFRSIGLDGVAGTKDDFDIARLSLRAGEEAESAPTATVPTGRGSIRGVIRDMAGMPAPGVEISLTGNAGRAVSGEDGAFAINDLAPGPYDVEYGGSGYLRVFIRGVPVSSGALDLSIIMPQRGSLNDVLANASLGMVMDSGESSLRVPSAQQEEAPKLSFTPRLREYFPETLLWHPSLETNRNGEAELRFKMPDSITSWRVSALASTVDGRMARAETSLLSFQRFFLDHDPPRILTEGDRIALPVAIRNYLDENHSVDVVMKPETWFTSAAPLKTTATARAGETARVFFDFTAARPIEQGRQRVTAAGRGIGDNVEKTVTVKPNGREVTHTESHTFRDALSIDVTVPGNARLDTLRGVVRIYPDPMAHVAEAIEGILERPHGCAEQVISSTYPSVIYLSQAPHRKADQYRAKARTFVQDGYRQLLRYQASDGGFTYWGTGESDLALTAYAVRFLFDADKFVDVDDKVRDRAAAWLVAQQRPDGAWRQSGAFASASEQVSQLTALVAYILSLRGNDEAVTKGLKYLRAQNEKDVNPYALAALALAALQIGKNDFASWALGRLEGVARRESGMFFWDSGEGTPFYGWGVAGRMESTALAVRALSEGMAKGLRSARTQELVGQGLAYMFSHKDRYGVWHSTQATIQVLDALVRVADSEKSRAGDRKARVEVIVNGATVSVIDLGGAERFATPLAVDVTRFLRAGANRIELRSSGMPQLATAQIVETHYAPWEDAASQPADGPLLRVRFDRTNGKLSDEFTGSVEVERGSVGAGMLLAEIGLPPGAEVNRASLEQALRSAGSLYRYEIQPDRIVAYLWPAGKSVARFQFTFRARFALDARTAPSRLYDYYNPDAQTVVAPTRFIVQ